jgi:RsiW-degrading membrane proteinase PrsW (M82 family)
MSEPSEPASGPETRKPIGDLVERTASEVRKDPVKSVIWAFFIGIFLTMFPVRRIVGILASVVLTLLRPVLLLLGVAKLCEEIEERRP